MLYRTLERFPGQVTWRPLKPGREDELAGPDGRRGRSPRSRPCRRRASCPSTSKASASPDPEDNVGLRIREAASGRRLAYFPAAGGVTPAVRDALADADCVFFDGTFWSSDELPALGLGRQARGGHGAPARSAAPGGSLAALRGLRAARRLYIHVNNTNPLLRDDSPERKAVEAAGWEVARDGMEVTL